MKYFFNYIGLATLSILFAASACNNSSTTTEETTTTETPVVTADTQVIPLTVPPMDTVVNQKQDTVLIKTSMGDITVVLYAGTPKHHDNFMKLVNEKFYNGVLFHRVISGFMIQTGDPESKKAQPGAMYGSGGPGYLIPNEINPKFLHKKGALAAARTENPEKASSGSQFYICHVATPQLDGNYTVFGETISGFDVIDKIAATATDQYDRPKKDIKILNTTILKNGKPVKEVKAAKGSDKDAQK